MLHTLHANARPQLSRRSARGNHLTHLQRVLRPPLLPSLAVTSSYSPPELSSTRTCSGAAQQQQEFHSLHEQRCRLLRWSCCKCLGHNCVSHHHPSGTAQAEPGLGPPALIEKRALPPPPECMHCCLTFAPLAAALLPLRGAALGMGSSWCVGCMPDITELVTLVDRMLRRLPIDRFEPTLGSTLLLEAVEAACSIALAALTCC